MNTNTTSLITEIGLIVISVAIVVGAVVLLILGKIDYAQAAGMMAPVVVLWLGNALYKAPSPVQAGQLKTLQDQASSLQEAASTHTAQIQSQQQQIGSVQELALHAANTAASVATQVQAQPTAAPALQFVQPVPQPVQYVDYGYGRHWGDSVPNIAAVQTQKIPTP